MNMSEESDGDRTLVSTGWLADRLDDASIRIFDCVTHLRPAEPGHGPYRPESGRADYEAGHIPGAGYLDLHGELSEHDADFHFMMPPEDQLTACFSRQGIGPGTRVVLYSSGHVMWATRVWWMLRALGFDDAAVLDGGLEKWRREGRPISTEPCRYPPAAFVVGDRRPLFVDRDAMLTAMEDDGVCVINALAPDYFRGEGESRYGRPGRIPGSVSVPASTLLNGTHEFVSLPEAEAKLSAAGALDADEVITYCGGGISATVDNFMLHRLGVDSVATYDASLSEWAADDTLPLERDVT